MGVSARFVTDMDEIVMEMPSGASGHQNSPYFTNMAPIWVQDNWPLDSANFQSVSATTTPHNDL